MDRIFFLLTYMQGRKYLYQDPECHNGSNSEMVDRDVDAWRQANEVNILMKQNLLTGQRAEPE